jgi:hypothetical protein
MDPFLPAGEIIGDKHLTRTITIADTPGLPDGSYQFIDHYCTDKTCDCRRAIIQVFHQDEHVSTVTYGWENEKFYTDWMRAGDDDVIAKEMSGLSLDWNSPDRVASKAMLALVGHLMDEKWISILKNHYRLMRKAL